MIWFTNACPQHSSWAPAVYGVVICTTKPVRNENSNQPLRCLQAAGRRTWNSELPSCLPSLSVDRNGLSGHLLTAGLREEAALHL